MIYISKYNELKEEERQFLDGVARDEFGHIPIVQNTEWATPDWSVINSQENSIVTFYNIVVRNISIDNKKVKVAGINNVITPKIFRGRGYSSKTLRSTQTFIFEDLKCKAGLLLCADELIPFYEKLGWYCVDCPVYFDQADGQKLWTANICCNQGNNNFRYEVSQCTFIEFNLQYPSQFNRILFIFSYHKKLIL